MSVLAPHIVDVKATHAPLALAHGRTPIEITTEGFGVLRVGDIRRVVRGTSRVTVLVPVAAVVIVRLRGLLRGERREVALRVVGEVPAPPTVDRAPPLRPDPRGLAARATVAVPSIRSTSLTVQLEPTSGEAS